MAKRGFGKSGVVADINVTPMADVMLVLLIIFMITTPLLQSGITVNLPKAKNPLDAPEADSKEAVVVAVNREGKLYLAKKQISEEDLYEFLSRKFSGGEINRTILPESGYRVVLWTSRADRQRLPQIRSGTHRPDG